LGLAIVRRIAERHGGAVAFARGRDGTGLRVTLRFPAAHSPATLNQMA
jgi:signal transduction histidine kinase